MKYWIKTIEMCGECPSFKDEPLPYRGYCFKLGKFFKRDKIPKKCPLQDVEKKESSSETEG